MRLQQEYPAGADELYRAFVDIDKLRQWFHPAPGMAPARAEPCTDPEGAELTYTTPVGDVSLRFSWRERVPGERLSFALHRTDPRGSTDSDVTITFTPHGAATRVALQHDGLDAEQEAEAEVAWRHSMGRLIGACPAAVDAYYARLSRAPGYRSEFGGLWPDRLDADERFAAKCSSGELDEQDAARFAHWREKGYVVLEGAVAPATIDALRAEVARDWERGNPDVSIELCEAEGGFHRMHPSLRSRPSKVLDYHGVSSNARDIQFAPAIQRFLEQLFERPPMACQSLLFQYGTEQAMHQDTAYVVMRSPMELVGCWVALEDVVEGSGELRYYEGSHRIPEYLWFDRAKARPPGYQDDSEFLAWVKRESERAGCKEVRFLPKKGDALVWHADLVHGGSPRVHRELTRWSLVTHYCPVDVDPAWMRPDHERHEHAPGSYYCKL